MRIIVDFSNFKLPDLNKIVKSLILADLFVLFGWGIINPLFAVFVIQDIKGATVVTVGILAAIYWITRAICQVPISLFLDKFDGEKDDFYALVFGLMVVAVAAFSYMLAQNIWHVYLITFIKGAGFALYVPPWRAIFSRHVDKDHTAYDWAIQSSIASLSVGVSGFVGGWLALALGFKLIFLLVGLLALVSAAILLFVPDLILPRKVTAEPSKPHPVAIKKIDGHV